MPDLTWIGLSRAEIEVVTEALSVLRLIEPTRGDEIDVLMARAKTPSLSPDVTIGVYGGAVQWVRGNPFPIRIIDYDGDRADLVDEDEEGHPCSIWTEPPDTELVTRA